MSLGWKVLLPVALAYIVVIASAVLGLQLAGYSPASWQFHAVLFGINVVLVIALLFVADRGRIVSPAYSRLDARNLNRLRAATASRIPKAEAPVEATR
jgi:NADH-quinone oxidoreductase subunit H